MDAKRLNDPEYIDNNVLFGMFNGEYLGLSLDNKKAERTVNVLVIGGTGSGKTFKYLKPNLLQENCSAIITDPSRDIFSSFAPYLMLRGYNVYEFSVADMTLSNHYNPLLNVYDSRGNISETQVDILVDLYMKNAKAGKQAGNQDPFWDKAEKAFMTALIYYVLESDEFGAEPPAWNKKLEWSNVFGDDWYSNKGERDGEQFDKCFSTVLRLTQMAKVSDNGEESPLTTRMNAFFERMDARGKSYKSKDYYDTFTIAPAKTGNTILMTTAVDLQLFANAEVDNITRYDYKHPQMNIDIDKIATQQSYLFLAIPQAHQAYNFLIAMLYSQLYSRLYELGENKLRGKWHIGYNVGTPVFDYFDSEKDAKDFYEKVSLSDIYESDYVNGTKIYDLLFYDKNAKRIKSYKTSFVKETLEKYIHDLDENKMVIWCGDKYAGSDPALPIHVNFYLDEFANIGEIPNFLNILSTSRKYRIGSHVIIQDIAQIKKMYKESEHETLIANTDTTIFLGSKLQADKKEMQEWLNKTTIRQRSTSSSKSGLSTSYTPTETNLISIDELEELNRGDNDDELVMIRDVRPFRCRKLYLSEHRRFKMLNEASGKIDYKRYFRNNGDDFNY